MKEHVPEPFPRALEMSQRGLPCAVWYSGNRVGTNWSLLAGCFRINTRLTRYFLGFLKKKKSGGLVDLLHAHELFLLRVALDFKALCFLGHDG